MEMEAEKRLPGAGRRGVGTECLWGDENVVEMDKVQDARDCTILWIH